MNVEESREWLKGGTCQDLVKIRDILFNNRDGVWLDTLQVQTLYELLRQLIPTEEEVKMARLVEKFC